MASLQDSLLVIYDYPGLRFAPDLGCNTTALQALAAVHAAEAGTAAIL